MMSPQQLQPAERPDVCMREWFASYGNCIRRIRYGGKPVVTAGGLKAWHSDGWATHDAVFNGRGGQAVSGSSGYEHTFPEVYSAKALEVRRALDKIPSDHKTIFDARWVYRIGYGPLARALHKRKADMIQIVWQIEGKVYRIVCQNDGAGKIVPDSK